MVNARGFTLIELIVSICISAIVVLFAVMFIAAPVDAYEIHSRRAAMVADTSGAWPRMEADLLSALPNSLRTRRNAINANLVVLEMLKMVDVVRYTTPPAASFNTAGLFRGLPLNFDSNNYPTSHYLSVNNLGTPGADAYALAGSMTPAGVRIQIAGVALTGESVVTLSIAPVLPASPRQRIYLVRGPVTYLCDEGQGTLRRYENYNVAAVQSTLDSPAALTAAGGGAGELVTQGLTSCSFAVSSLGPGANPSQTAAVRLTTTRNGDSVTLLHSFHQEYLP